MFVEIVISIVIGVAVVALLNFGTVGPGRKRFTLQSKRGEKKRAKWIAPAISFFYFFLGVVVSIIAPEIRLFLGL